MSDFARTIKAVGSAHDAASLRLRDVCQSLKPKQPDGRLNDVGRIMIFQMLDASLTNKDIAQALGISSPAVTHYRRLHENVSGMSTRKRAVRGTVVMTK